jgi:hypothetical protein
VVLASLALISRIYACHEYYMLFEKVICFCTDFLQRRLTSPPLKRHKVFGSKAKRMAALALDFFRNGLSRKIFAGTIDT